MIRIKSFSASFVSTNQLIGSHRYVIPSAFSPLERTVVLGVTSRSREALKGKAQSCDIVAASSRDSSRCRQDGADLWPPMLVTQIRQPTPAPLRRYSLSEREQKWLNLCGGGPKVGLSHAHRSWH